MIEKEEANELEKDVLEKDVLEKDKIEGFEEGLELEDVPASLQPLNPDHTPICWSTSRADTAEQCLFKYNMIYNKKIRAKSKALNLGGFVHRIQAEQLVNGNDDPTKIVAYLDKLSETEEVYPEVYQMVPNIVSFVTRWKDLAAKDNLKATVEKQYAMDLNGKSVGFFSKEARIRLVIDMWAHDPVNKRLIIIDHKTNKSALGQKAVSEYKQLKLYVYGLSEMFDLPWNKAHVALHFLRFGKIVWATMTPKECKDFAEGYKKYLQLLDDKVSKAEYSNKWESEKGFWCNYCTFKQECAGLANPLR